jgi:hypothetical protein
MGALTGSLGARPCASAIVAFQYFVNGLWRFVKIQHRCAHGILKSSIIEAV